MKARSKGSTGVCTCATVTTHRVAETLAFGRKLATQLQVGDVVALTGELGAGKTCLTQGIAAGLGIREPVTSPTFTLISEHQGKKLPLYHIDLYRLDSAAQALQIGIEEYLDSDGVTVIEWAEKIPELLPARAIHVRLDILENGARQIQCTRGINAYLGHRNF